MECDICLENYNEGRRLPRSLCCGHTFCTQCLAQIMKGGPLKCPYCRSQHRGFLLCPADLPLHEKLVAQLLETQQSEDQRCSEDSSEAEHLSILKLREDVRKASAGNRHFWTKLVTQGGATRYARVSLLNDRLHLHVLQDEEPAGGAQPIPYNLIQELADEDFCIVFLDVSWGGHFRGRVYIVLLDEEGRTQQFKSLCTGRLGPSYLGTRFLEVSRKGKAGEQVWGGDYENNDGSGGDALPGMERGKKNYHEVVAGLVAGFYFSGYGEDHPASQFGIFTKDMPEHVEMSSLGRVMDGLEVVTTVAGLEDIRSAVVSDCGLLLYH